jgi:hypothetical protein
VIRWLLFAFGVAGYPDHESASDFRVVVGRGGLLAQQGTFVAVTDRMLENPDPADWLMWRRTFNSWGYSPLDQINRANVGAPENDLDTRYGARRAGSHASRV